MVEDLVKSMIDKNLIKTGRFNSFQVYIKEKGKWKRLGNPTTRDNALDIGSKYVDINPSAVFKIVKSNEAPSINKDIDFGYFRYNIDKFRASRIKNKKEQKFTEKEKYRIDSNVEKMKISKKGLKKRRIGSLFELR